ncbi:MAG: hypothetical protein H6707_20045 [Deltaproteobacteria bacterium]|nr:hypothetical protein [Deltaproteobacteria bacterium]
MTVNRWLNGALLALGSMLLLGACEGPADTLSEAVATKAQRPPSPLTIFVLPAANVANWDGRGAIPGGHAGANAACRAAAQQAELPNANCYFALLSSEMYHYFEVFGWLDNPLQNPHGTINYKGNVRTLNQLRAGVPTTSLWDAVYFFKADGSRVQCSEMGGFSFDVWTGMTQSAAPGNDCQTWSSSSSSYSGHVAAWMFDRESGPTSVIDGSAWQTCTPEVAPYDKNGAGVLAYTQNTYCGVSYDGLVCTGGIPCI